MIEAGQQAPDFTLRDEAGNEVTLSALRGSRVVLAFYPLDWSPGCSNQMAAFTADYPKFEAQGAKVFGISVDSAWSHKAWRDALGIPFPLLADFHPKGAVSELYGVYNAERGNGRRVTVVVDEQGIVRDVNVSNQGEIPSVDAVCSVLAGIG